MALDYMAIVSYGVYPTPVPDSDERAAFGVSYGLLGTVPAAVPFSGRHNILTIGMDFLINAGSKFIQLFLGD